MPSYLQVERLSKSYGPKVLFENIAFNVNEGDKIAMIAPNGTGKTSLMRILAGKDSSDGGGSVLFLKDIKIAFLEQEFEFDPKKSIEQQIFEGEDFDFNSGRERFWTNSPSSLPKLWESSREEKLKGWLSHSYSQGMRIS